MMKQFTFSKKERLSQKGHIDSLFNEGRSFYLSPFKVFYRETDTGPGLKPRILLAIAKKKFKKAVDRNRLRRLIREAYRLNKHLLFESMAEQSRCLHIGFVFIGDKADISYEEIEKQMIACLERLSRIISDSNNMGG